MNKDISAAILDIIILGLERIDYCAGNDNVAGCQIEAYHIHNLPEALRFESMDMVRCYIYYERPEFMSRANISTSQFDLLWKRLEKVYKASLESPIR